MSAVNVDFQRELHDAYECYALVDELNAKMHESAAVTPMSKTAYSVNGWIFDSQDELEAYLEAHGEGSEAKTDEVADEADGTAELDEVAHEVGWRLL
jgi:hypothetical protein